MSCKSCCAECRSEAYWCCKDQWKCNRVRRKMCIHYKKEMKMFKNITIMGLVIVILLLLISGNINLPNVSSIKCGSIENKLLNVVQQIEADKQREQAMIKVNEIVEILKQ